MLFAASLKKEARVALGRKDKKGALNIMRKVARVRKDIQDKDVQYQRLLAMLEQLAASKQTKEIIDVSNAFREAMARQGLTPDKALEEAEERRTAERAKAVGVPVAVPAAIAEENNRIRVGKRVLNLDDLLPEVPKSILI
ncbi:hypothetical protein niasHT_038273 [Heterodera trifolii]|uniref:Uncharacterized protein n=1 Tax=Heterodera trifolii TaxID=157864 RepID=A0ABD2HVP4_9BILA